MAVIPSISDSEWEIMKVLWERAPRTAGQIVAELAPGRKWHPRTVKTLVGRLVRKGAVSVEVAGRQYLYRANVSRDACRREEARSFLSRVFDGAAAPAVVQFIREGNLSAREIEELRRILDEEQP